MQNKESFVLYTKYIDTFKELSDEDAGKLIKCILEYVNDMNPEPTGIVKIAFIPIKQQLKEDLAKWKEEKEKRSLAGKKGMESRYSNDNKKLTNDNNVSKCYNKTNNVKNELTNLTDNVNVYVNDNVFNNNNNNIITNNTITNNIIISVELPLIDGTLYQISEDKVKEWQQVYQAIDVKNELEKMKCWLNANPKNRKTIKGIERFIVAWLNRSQDKAPRIITSKPINEIQDSKTAQDSIQEVDEDIVNQLKTLMGV